MERRIPDPLTLEDLRRDPDLIFAVHARARRMRTAEQRQLLGALFKRIWAARPTLGPAAARGYRLGAS